MIVTRPVVGFRSWEATADGALYSMYVTGAERMYWKWGGVAAECPNATVQELRPHEAPSDDCGCGIHAKAQIEPDGGSTVHGAIVAWGRIVLHEHGFRAQFARPIALLADEDYPPGFDSSGYRAGRIAAVAEKRGLPVLSADELAAYGLWHGDLLVHPALADYYRNVKLRINASS